MFEELRGQFRGREEYLAMQLVRLVEQFVRSDRLVIPSEWHSEPLRRRILLTLQVDLIVQHLKRHLYEQNVERLEPVFDGDAPIGSTRWMRTWYTTKRTLPTQGSQISHVVADSAWEGHVANILESSDLVETYAKNDHLNFHVQYLWNGSRRRFVPDFLIRLANGKTLVLEVKGQDTPQNRAKRSALKGWTQAVNSRGGFGVWCDDVAFEMAQIQDILSRHAPDSSTAHNSAA